MNQRDWFKEDEASGPVPGDLPLPEARLELPATNRPELSEEDEPLSPQMESYFFSDEDTEVVPQVTATPELGNQGTPVDPTDIPVMEASETGVKSLLGDMVKAEPIQSDIDGLFSEEGGRVLSPDEARDSETEMSSSDDSRAWYETSPSFDLEIKPFGQNPLSTGMAPTAMNEAFPDGLPASNEDPVNTIPNALERGWKTAQKSFSFVSGAAGLPGQMQVQADLERDIEQIPRDQATAKLEAAVNSENPWEATKELVRSQGALGMTALGAEAVLSLGTESGAMFLPGTFVLGALRVPPLAAGFLNSLSLEYSSAFMDGLKASGVDTSDPDAVEKALQDEQFLTNIRQASWAKAIPVAAFDAITLGLGGKLARGIYKNVVKRLGRNQLGRVAGYSAAGAGTLPSAMATGMTGEAVGQGAQQAVFASQAGQEIDLGTLVPRDRFSVLAEGIGEIGGPLTASLAFETVPGLARQTLKPAVEPMTEYLRQSGAPQTAQALAQANQTQPVSDEDRKAFATRVSEAPAYAGRTEAYPETPPAEGELTDFSRLAAVIDDIIQKGKSEKRQTQPKEESAASETAKSPDGETPAAAPTPVQPEASQQSGEASQATLTEPAAAPEPIAYERAVDYAVDWYMTKKRPQLLNENLMSEKDVFPSQTTYGDFAVEILQLLEASGIEGPKTVDEAKVFFTNVASRIRSRVVGEPPETDAGGGDPPEQEPTAVTIKDNMSAVEFLGTAIQNLTRDEAKKPKLKKLSGKNVTGEIKLAQESEAYVQMLNEMPEAPGENDALLQADKYFRGKIGAILKDNPSYQGLDLDRLRNASRLRLQRQIRNKYQQLRRRGSLTEGQAAEKFLTDVLPRINPAIVFRSIYSEFGRKLARRSAAKVGLQSAVSLDAPFDRDSSLNFGDILADKSDTEQDEQVLADIGRNARNEYFNSLQKDIAKNLIFRAAMNLKPGADISKDAGRLRKIQDALEASGESVDFDKLQKMAVDLMKDFREKVSAKVNADYERYQNTGVIPDLVSGPENMKYLTAGKEVTGPYVGRADREAQALAEETLEQLLEKKLLTEQQAVIVQDILDENPRKSGSIAAMREMQAMLSSAQVTSRAKEPVTRVISNNPPIADQTPDEFVLMDVQRQGASMIFQAHMLGRKGALLADTAGLGKTRTALAAAKMISRDITRRLQNATKEEALPGKIIYITESRELIESSAGGARAQLASGNIPADRVYFKTYDDFSKGKIDFEDADVIIFDEAQNLKNPESERAKLAKIGNAFHIYVSATPADKLKSVKYFLPRITGRPTAEVENDINMAKDKAEIIASYLEQAGESYAYIRREPVRGLPQANQIELNLPDELVENLRAIENYHQLRMDSLSEKVLNGSITDEQASAERLKITADRKRSLERYIEMSKTEQAYFLAKEALDAGRQVLIFGEAVNPTHFPELGVTEPAPSALEMLKARFEKEGVGVASIYGEGGDSMISDINDFMRGSKKVALLTPYKGGAGLNLDDQTGERPRTVINLTINEAADKDEQMRSRAGGRLSSKSDVEYIELVTDTPTDRDRRDLRAKKQRILKVTQGATPDTRDTNQLLLEFQDVIVTNQKPVLQMPDVDPTLAPKYNDGAKTRERMNRQLVDDRITTLRAFERNAIQRLAQSLDELGFRGTRIEFADYSGKAVWTDWTRMAFNTIYVNPKMLASSLDVVASSDGELGGLFLRAMGLEEVHHNQVYLLTENFAKQLFENQIASGQMSSKEAFRRVYTTILRGVYDEMSPAMRADTAARYRKSAMSPEMTAMEFLRSLYQELKLEYTTEDFLTEERRQALARKLQGVPRDGMIRMWLELLRQSVLSLLRKAEKTFAQAPLLSNMLDATDNMIQYLTDNGPPYGKQEITKSAMFQELKKMFNIAPVQTQENINEEGRAPIRVSRSEREQLLDRINEEVSKPVAVIDGVLLSNVPSSTRGLSGKVYAGRYAWVKADKLQGSHLKNFGPNPKYPFLNTRDYASSQGDQDKVLSGAKNFQPDMFVTNSLSANGGLQTVIRGKRSGDFYLAAGNGRHLIAQYATEMADTRGEQNLKDLVNKMAEVANKEGVALPDDLYSYRLVKVLDFEIDEADKSVKREIEEIISDLNDGGGRQTSALGKSEQDLPTVLGNETLKAQLEKFATGEKELTPNTASEFVRQAVGLKAINQLERGFLAEPSERSSALFYVRYLLTRAYSSPNIPMTVTGKNMQVLYAQEVMNFSDENWGMAMKLLRVNALSSILGDKGKALKSAVDQLIYLLSTQAENSKANFFSLLDSTRQREDELMTAMLSPEEAETQRKMEQLSDLLQSQLEKKKHRQTGKVVIDVAKSRSRINRLLLAMGDHLYTSYLEKKQDLKGAAKLDLGDVVEDAVEYMIQVIKARIASNPDAFRQSEEDAEYDPVAASEVEGGDFDQPATADTDPDSEENRELLDPVINDEELKPENLVWQAWKEDGDVDFGFKSRTAYNRLLTYLDQAGYGKYLRFRKILESMARDEAWVEEMGKRLDEETELQDQMDKAKGKTITRKMDLLKMGIPTKDETLEVMRLTNVYAKDGRVAQLIEPIVGKIEYPKVSSAILNQRDEAVAMMTRAQAEIERLVKAKEYRILRENPRFAAEAAYLLEEINDAYQKYISKNVSPIVMESVEEQDKKEKQEGRERVAKLKAAKVKDVFKSIHIDAAIEQIKKNSIQMYKATPSVNQRIAPVLKSLEEVGQNLNALAVARDVSMQKLMDMTKMGYEELSTEVEDTDLKKPDRQRRISKITSGRGEMFAKRQEIAKVLGINEQINRHRMVEQRLLLVLNELEGFKDQARVEALEVVNEKKQLTKAEIENLPVKTLTEMLKRKFDMPGPLNLPAELATIETLKETPGLPIYAGTIQWKDPRPGKGVVQARTLSQAVSRASGKPVYNTVIVSFMTETGEVPLPTFTDGRPITREEGKTLTAAYYEKGGTSIIATPQVARDSLNIVRIEPVGMFLRGDKFYSPAPAVTAKAPKIKILELPMAQRYSKSEPEVNARGERWYEFTLDPENKRSHQRVYVRATNHLDAIRKAVEKMTEKGQSILYKGKLYSQRQPERTIRVPKEQADNDTTAGLTPDELDLRKAIQRADVEKMRELIQSGRAKDEDYIWYAKREAEAIITSLYEQGRELEDPEVIAIAKEFGFIDVTGKQKPDLRGLRRLREISVSKRTPKTMGVSRNIGRSGLVKDVGVNMALFGNQSKTKEVPAPEQIFKLQELPRKTSADVLEEIAMTNGTTVEELRQVNNLTGAALAPGASILIPGTTRSVKIPDYNLVQEGPSLLKVAKQYGVTREELAKANNLPEDYIVKPGDEIIIPATKFRDTTKDLVDRLFKERVYEAGPTMLRVNTPPPGIRIVNDANEPMAAATVDPEEQRKKDLLAIADLPLFAKQEVKQSQESGDSFMETLAKLKKAVESLRENSPEMLQELAGPEQDAGFRWFMRVLNQPNKKNADKIRGTLYALAAKYGRRVKIINSYDLIYRNGKKIYDPVMVASAMSKLQRLYKDKEDGIPKFATQFVSTYETRIDWDKIRTSQDLEAEARKVAEKLLTYNEKYKLKTQDKINWEKEWENLSKAKDRPTNEVFVRPEHDILLNRVLNKISDNFSNNGVLVPFDSSSQSQKEVLLDYLNAIRRSELGEWWLNINEHWLGKNAIIYGLNNKNESPYVMALVAGVVQKSLAEKRRYGYVLPWRGLLMAGVIQDVLKNKMPPSSDLKKAYENKLNEYAALKTQKQIDLGDGKKWIYVPNAEENPNIEESAQIVADISCRGWCIRNQTYTKGQLNDGVGYWFLQNNGQTELAVVVRGEKGWDKKWKVVTEVEDEFNEGHTVLRKKHREMVKALGLREGFAFDIDLTEGAPVEEMSAAQEWAEYQQRKTDLEQELTEIEEGDAIEQDLETQVKRDRVENPFLPGFEDPLNGELTLRDWYETAKRLRLLNVESEEPISYEEFKRLYEDSDNLAGENGLAEYEGERLRGYFNTTDETMYFVLDNITDETVARRLFYHEASHGNVYRLAQTEKGKKEITEILNGSKEMLLNSVEEILDGTGYTLASLKQAYNFKDEAALLGELLARYAERLADKPQPSWFKELLGKISRWMKKHLGLPMSSEDVFLWLSSKMREPAGNKTSEQLATEFFASYDGSGRGMWEEIPTKQKHTYTLKLGRYDVQTTEAYGRKEAIGKNLYKLFRKHGVLTHNERLYFPRQLGLLTSILDKSRGWADPVRRIDYNEDGSIDQPVAAGEVEPPTGEEAERIYRARRLSQKREGKRKIRGFVKTYGNDGEIDKDLRDATALAGIRYHVRTQPLRAEEAVDVIERAGGPIAVARELIAPETDNQELMAISSNPIEFDNLVILNSILLKQLDRTYKVAKLNKDQHTATEAMNLSLQLAGKQAELGTKLGRGLAAFAAYTRLSPAGWRYFMTQQFEQARLEQINLLPTQLERVAVGAKSAVAEAFEKVVEQPEVKKLLDKIDELANSKAWDAMLKRAEKVAKIAGEATGKDRAKRDKEFEKILKDTKQLIAMIKKQKDEMAVLQLESAISEGVAAALMKGVDSPEETAEKLGISKQEVLDNVEPAQDRLDEVRQKSVDELRAILPEELRDKPLNWIFDGEEPAASSTPEESIEDGDSVEDELAEAEEIQTSKMLKKFLVDFAKALRDRDKEASLPQEKIKSIVRRILRENLQKASPELGLRRAKLSTLDRQTRAITRFRKALSVWKEIQGTAGDDAFLEAAATSLNKLLPPGQTELVLAALSESMDQPYTKADLKAFLTIRNSNIREYLFSRTYELYELRAQVIENLMVDLRANGLEVDETLLASVLKKIKGQLEELAGEEFQKRLQQEDLKSLPKLKVFKESSNDIVKLALLQKLDNTSLLTGLQKKLGLDEGSWAPAQEVLDSVTKKAEKIANDPDGPNSRRAIRNTVDLLDTIRKEVGFNLLDVFQSFFYVNIIGGVKTVTTNLFAPVSSALHFALLYPSTNKKRRQGMVYALQRVRQAFNQGLSEFLSVISTGDIAGKVTYLDNMAGAVGQRKTGRQNIELFLDKDAKYYTKLPAFGWLVPLAKFWYGIGDKNKKAGFEIGIPKKLWDGAFSLLKTKPVRKLVGNIRTPEYPEKGVRASVSIAGLGALVGRLYSGLDVFWTAAYSEIHAAMTAHELAYEEARQNEGRTSGRLPSNQATAIGDDLDNIRINADALMGYDMGSKLKAARQIAREKMTEDSSGRDTPGYHPLAEQLRKQAKEEKLESLKRGTLEYRQQFYLNRIRNRAYSNKLPDQEDIQKSMARRDKLTPREKIALEKKIQIRNQAVNKMIWESLFMGQWMAQVNQPYGMIGKAAKLFENIVKRQGFRALAFIQPFFSIVANVYTIWLNWMGVGALKNMGPKSRQIEVYGEGVREKPEVLREYERSSGAISGLTMLVFAALMASFRVFDDDDEENLAKEKWFDITGRGPKDIDQRKALEATGQWQRDSFKFGKTWIKIPVYTPFYLALKAVGDIRDYTKYDVPTHGGMLDLGMEFVARIIGAAIRGPLDVPFVSGLKTTMDALNTENPNWMTKAGGLISRTVGGIAVPGVLRELDQRVIDQTTREKSGGFLATMLGNLPFLRSVNKPATNVLGEEIKFNNPPQGKSTGILENYLEIFLTRRAEVDPLFEVLMAKGAWITMPPNRVTVMGTRLKDEPADEWKMKRAEILRETFREDGKVEELWGMSPAEAQAYAAGMTEAANREADAHILEKYPEVMERVESYLERKSMYGPRGVK